MGDDLNKNYAYIYIIKVLILPTMQLDLCWCTASSDELTNTFCMVWTVERYATVLVAPNKVLILNS